jgi:hypothetical protein
MAVKPLCTTSEAHPVWAAVGRIFRIAGGCVLISILVGLLSCGSQADSQADFPPIGFEVRQDLLSAPFMVDSAFVMQAPEAWAEADTASFYKISGVIRSDTAAFFPLEPLRIFISPKAASCIISRIDARLPVFGLLDRDFEESLKSTSGSEDIVRGAFSVDGVQVIQYRVVTPEIVAFKLFCRAGGGWFQIDYLFPAGIYGEEIHKLESSIGSIRAVSLESKIEGR